MENAETITGPDSIIFTKSDLFETYKKKHFDLILTNPPYINARDKDKLQRDILFEPEEALFAENDGREIIRRIIMEAKEHLCDAGYIIMEIGHDQEDYVRMTANDNEWAVTILKDIANLPRIAVLQYIT